MVKDIISKTIIGSILIVLTKLIGHFIKVPLDNILCWAIIILTLLAILFKEEIKKLLTNIKNWFKSYPFNRFVIDFIIIKHKINNKLKIKNAKIVFKPNDGTEHSWNINFEKINKTFAQEIMNGAFLVSRNGREDLEVLNQIVNKIYKLNSGRLIKN